MLRKEKRSYLRYKSKFFTKEEFAFEEDMEGIVLTEKMASMLGVTVGDTISVKTDDTTSVEVKIAYLTENYAMHYIYLTPKLYEELFEEVPEYNLLYYKSLDNSEEARNYHDSANEVSQSDLEKQQKEMKSLLKKKGHPKGDLLFIGTPERTLTSDLPLRRRLLYTTELLRHMDFALWSILEYYSGNPGRCQGLKKSKIPLYRFVFFRYNKLICYGHNTFLMEYLI